MTLTIVKNKTLSEWFDSLDLEQKLSIYKLNTPKPIEFNNIFYPADDSPKTVGTFKFGYEWNQ